MKKYFNLFSVVLLVFLFGCQSDDESGNGDRFEYSFYENAQITLSEFNFSDVSPGNNLVFRYYFLADENPNISDDEYAERIIFEIPSDADEFSFTNAELSNINTYFDKFCFCFIEGSIPISEGTISGSKINATTWEVSIDVSFEDFQLETRTISERFSLTPLN